MGCPALTYHQKEDRNFFHGLWKKSGGPEKSYKYYPFGLQTSTSWTRENTKDNNYLYNAANELNKTTGWYEMYYRGYDPAIGRMLQVDPYATMYASATTYNYALNNPVMMNDPYGGQVSVNGYTGGQLRAMYRNDFYNHGYSGSYGDWASDNLDFGGSGGRTVIGTDGREYGANRNGQIGYWRDVASIEENSAGTGGYEWVLKTMFVEVGTQGGWDNSRITNNPPSGDNYSGHAIGVNLSVVAGGGFTLAFGYVQNKAGKGSWFFTIAPMTAVGLEASAGGFASDIESTDGSDFDISEYEGWGYNHSVSLPFGGYSIGGNSNDKSDTKWGRTYEEQQGSYGPGIGYSYAKTYTFLFWGDD